MPPAMPPPWGRLGRPADSSCRRAVRVDVRGRADGWRKAVINRELATGHWRPGETDLVVLANFAHELTKRLVDVDPLLC